MSRRRLQALRNLAERPGTEAEGVSARAFLGRLEGKEPTEAERWKSFESYLRTGSDGDLAWACSRKCDCGANVPSGQKCQNDPEHFRIRVQLTQKFPRGTRVFYNKWAYSANCAGVVTGYPVKQFTGSWGWIRVKFDHLKQARSIPIHTALGWHLSTEPLSRAQRSPLREGMEEQDAFQEAIDTGGRYHAIVQAMNGDFGDGIRDTMRRVWRDEACLAAEYARMDSL